MKCLGEKRVPFPNKHPSWPLIFRLGLWVFSYPQVPLCPSPVSLGNSSMEKQVLDFCENFRVTKNALGVLGKSVKLGLLLLWGFLSQEMLQQGKSGSILSNQQKSILYRHEQRFYIYIHIFTYIHVYTYIYTYMCVYIYISVVVPGTDWPKTKHSSVPKRFVLICLQGQV